MTGPIIHAVMYRDYKLGTICNSDAWGPAIHFSTVTSEVTCTGCRNKLGIIETAPNIYDEIRTERVRAHAKHGENSMDERPVDAYFRYTILAEEVGEIAKEFNEAEARGGQDTLDLQRVRRECIQVAAMAAAWADRIPAGDRP